MEIDTIKFSIEEIRLARREAPEASKLQIHIDGRKEKKKKKKKKKKKDTKFVN